MCLLPLTIQIWVTPKVVFDEVSPRLWHHRPLHSVQHLHHDRVKQKKHVTSN